MYLIPNTTNVIYVTWRERSVNTTGQYWLVLKNIATNVETTITINYASDTSLYPLRYNKFSIVIGNLNPGQYEYIAYQRNAGNTDYAGVVETGLAYVQTTEAAIYEGTETITYVQ